MAPSEVRFVHVYDTRPSKRKKIIKTSTVTDEKQK